MASGSTWLPVNTLMLKVSFFLCSQALRHPSSPWPLRRTVGDSVQLQLNTSLSSNIRDIEWVWVPEYSKLPVSVVSVVWRPPSLDANWYRLEEKYRQKLNLTKTASLSIRNLTVDMSGLYTARIKFHTGENQEEAFRLSVYEPTPQPRILIHSSYLSSDWCNVSLECGVPGPRKHLTVAWESKGLSRELEQQGGSSLSLSLPLIQSQSKVSLTCVLSSPVGQKKDTLHLGSICAQNESLTSKWLWSGILLVVLLVILVAAVWTFIERQKSRRGGPTLRPVVLGSEAAPKPHTRVEATDIQVGNNHSQDSTYSEISLPKHPEAYMEKGRPAHYPESVTIYEKIRLSPEPTGMLKGTRTRTVEPGGAL